MAMIKISWKSCSAALSVRGSSNNLRTRYIFPKRLPRGDSLAIGQNPSQPKRIALQSATKISNAIPWLGGPGRKNEAHCGKSLAKEKKLWF
jgi:hypothetical protein